MGAAKKRFERVSVLGCLGARGHTAMVPAVLAFLLPILVAGCGGGSSERPAASGNSLPIVATTRLAPARMETNYSFTLKASGGTPGYTWSVSSGSLPRWATLDPATGTITGKPDVTGATTFSVNVRDDRMLTSAAQALTLTVDSPLALTIYTDPYSVPDGTVGIPYSIRVEANGGVQPYAWTISSGSLPTWANFDSNTGAIVGSPDAVGTSSFTIQATDSQSPPYVATKTLTIRVNEQSSANNAELKGQYAFLFQGFDDATKDQFALVGSFQADGTGNITSGIEDVNGPEGYKPAVNFSGKYNVGTDNRGFMVVSNPSGGTTTFAFALGSLNSNHVATKAGLIEFDDVSGTAGRRGSGSISLQDTKSFSLSSIQGPHAFQITGQSDKTGTRAVVTGAYVTDGSGNLSSGDEDVNDNGKVTHSSFTGKFSSTTDTTLSGRMTLQTANSSNTSDFAAYIVSAKRIFTMTAAKESTSGLESGEMRARSASSFSAASLNGASVGYSEGISWLTAGRWSFDGSGNLGYTFISGDAKGINYNVYYPQSGTLSYSVSPNGRVTTLGSLPSGVLSGPIIYLVGPNEAFLMSTDSSAASGYFEPQIDGPFSNASLSGSYMLRTIAPAVAGETVGSEVLTSPGDGTFTVISDTSSATGALNNGQERHLQILIYPEGLGIDSEFLSDFAYIISFKKAVFAWEIRNWPVLTMMEH